MKPLSLNNYIVLTTDTLYDHKPVYSERNRTMYACLQTYPKINKTLSNVNITNDNQLFAAHFLNN